MDDAWPAWAADLVAADAVDGVAVAAGLGVAVGVDGLGAAADGWEGAAAGGAGGFEPPILSEIVGAGAGASV